MLFPKRKKNTKRQKPKTKEWRQRRGKICRLFQAIPWKMLRGMPSRCQDWKRLLECFSGNGCFLSACLWPGSGRARALWEVWPFEWFGRRQLGAWPEGSRLCGPFHPTPPREAHGWSCSVFSFSLAFFIFRFASFLFSLSLNKKVKFQRKLIKSSGPTFWKR